MTTTPGIDDEGRGRDAGEPPRILVVDDDPAIRRALERGLRLAGYRVLLASDGAAALAVIGTAEHPTPRAPHVIVLDVAMPGCSGIEVCATLRARGIETPVLMLSARDETADRITGLESGADDYLVKPFDLRELELRLRALLRRRPPTAPGDAVLRAGPLVLDAAAHLATNDGEPVNLTRREFALLDVFVRNAGQVLTRDQLLARVWGYDFEVRTDVVDTFVSYLRRKLEAGGRPRLLHTVRGVGFVLRVPDGRG
ncbi:response regulator transcription factor [Embleya scabrispora]|uniref:response regulator transcription factor n=1 Tax=Embleya scabrispora TaxID=159449 RepID=UPI0003604B22|nr:response regulator transcription factor [Embleya scabrispora]MYS85981.1 response regulator [Streptomyces sp. SID5474]